MDFLRAVSILFVITGHWLITTAEWDADTQTLRPLLALESVPWTAWLTWLFQVMPIFFIVGGYSNAISLESARDKHLGYAQWLTGRLHRLLTPLLLLVLVWAVVSLLMQLAGAAESTIRFVSRTALVPTWFLAIYTMIDKIFSGFERRPVTPFGDAGVLPPLRLTCFWQSLWTSLFSSWS